jgi:hypothetical protein
MSAELTLTDFSEGWPLGWCDKLASVPSVGFGLNWHFISSNAILDSLARILDPLIEQDRPSFTVVRQEPHSVGINLNNGFQYGVEPARVFVGFQHTMKAKAVSGSPPIMEMLSRPLPYTELLRSGVTRLTEATLALPGINQRRVTRVGIVSTTVVSEGDFPPGVSRFVEYVGRPWQTQLIEGFSFQFTTQLRETESEVDKCLHGFVKPANSDELLTLTLDWQRTFKVGQPINQTTLGRMLAGAERDAQAYFEEIAEGDRFDDRGDRPAT